MTNDTKYGSPEDEIDRGGKPRQRRVLSLPVLAVSLGVVLVGAPATYSWHKFQVGRTAQGFLDEADRREAAGEGIAAAEFLWRYLQLHPGDADARARLAQVYDRAAKDGYQEGRAIELYYAALGVAPAGKETALRRRLVDLLMETGRWAQVEEEARKLLAADDRDPAGRRALALALYSQFEIGALANDSAKIASISEAIQRALDVNKGSIELSIALAGVLRDREHATQLLTKEQKAMAEEARAKLADEIVDRMVAANPDNPESYLARYDYRIACARDVAKAGFRLRSTRLSDMQAAARDAVLKAGSDLEAALAHGPENLKALLKAADYAQEMARIETRRHAPERAKAQLEKARDLYARAVKAAPAAQAAYAYAGLGDIYATLGQKDRAMEVWRQGLEGDKESIELNLRLADALVQQDQEKSRAEVKSIIDVLKLALEKSSRLLSPSNRLALERKVRLLEARWLVSKHDYLPAIPLLKNVTAGETAFTTEIGQTYQAWVLLGMAYSALEQWELAGGAYDQATTMDPSNARVHLAAAAAWAAAGRYENAAPHYEKALQVEDSADTWSLLAEARYECQRRLPKSKRNWGPFIEALTASQKSKAGKPVTDPWRATQLEANFRLTRGEEQGDQEQARRDAVRLLQEAENQHSDSAKLLERLAMAYEQIGYSADADRALEKAVRLGKDPAECQLVRAALYTNRKQYEQARQVLDAGRKTARPAMVPAFGSALVQLSLEEGKTKQAIEELAKLHAKYPSNQLFLRQLVELALDARQFAEAAKYEEPLRELEGAAGVYWRFYQARRLLAGVKQAGDPAVAQATELEQFIERQRPMWSPGLLLKGQLAELRGDFLQAVEAYQQAIQLGERRVAVFERLVSLLFGMKRYDEANDYLSRLQGQGPLSERLESLEVLLAVKRDKPEMAVTLARRAVQGRPKDPLAWIRLGQMLLVDEKLQEAEAAFRQAVQLAPTDVRTRDALFGFYVRTKQIPKARETLDELAKNGKLTNVQRVSVLAQGYEVVGDGKEAERNYREAAALAPKDVSAQMRLAQFLLRGRDQSRLAEAEQALRRVLELSPDSVAARRELAQLLALRGGEEAWAEAQHLLEQSGAATGASGLDRRLQAVLLVRRGGKENLHKAHRILDQLIADPKQSADSDRLLLARVYEAEGDVKAADQQYLTLLKRDTPNLLHVAVYADFLLRHRQELDRPNDRALDRADVWIGKLEAKAATAVETIDLRARWLALRGESNKIEPMVEAVAARMLKQVQKDPNKQLQVALAIGGVYASVDLYAQAQRWYEQVRKLVPNRYQPLAMALARQGRIRQAIQLCLEASKTDSTAGPAIVVASVLAAGHPRQEDFRLAEPILAKALASEKDDVELLSAVAVVRVVAQQNQAAIDLYERLRKLKPKNVIVLNNLASLLAEQSGKSADALRYIDQAIDLAGPQPALLDTKGTVLLLNGKLGEAVSCLQAAVSDIQPDPRFHFHLAVAYDRLGQTEKAREALKKATEGKLEEQVLTAVDRRMYAELEKKLNSKQPGHKTGLTGT